MMVVVRLVLALLLLPILLPIGVVWLTYLLLVWAWTGRVETRVNLPPTSPYKTSSTAGVN
jgi:hypothetical protein